MIGLIIALFIVALIIFLLLSSLTVVFDIENEIIFKVKFLGITLFDLKPHKKTKPLSAPKKSAPKKEKKKFSTTLIEYAKGKNKKELIQEILEIIKELCVKFGRLLKHITFNKLEFNLIVASDNAATTAILYGNLCAVIYSICGMLSSAYNFDAEKIKVSTDFVSEKISFLLKCKIKVKLIYIVIFLLSAAFSIIKLRIGEVKNGRA